MAIKDYKSLGCFTLSKHKIITNSEKPIYIQPYRKSQKERLDIQCEINKLLEAKIIRPSKSPWSAPVVLIPKPDGSKRFCVDFNLLLIFCVN